jgi:hypothetical protein
MALYKHVQYLTQTNDAAFDLDHKPGQLAPFSAIYRCMGCQKEVASNQHQPLPPQNDHQHTPQQGAIRWRMIVYADHKPK